VLLSTVPVHRVCKTLRIVFTFGNAGLHPDDGSSGLKYCASAQNVADITHIFSIMRCRPTRTCGFKCSQVLCVRTECVRGDSYFLHFGMLVYTQMRGQVLSSTVPAHRMCQTLLMFFTFRDAFLQPDGASSALNYRAFAQIVSDVTNSSYILVCCPKPRWGLKCFQVPSLRTECVRRHS
jgi:hypothetical protein